MRRLLSSKGDVTSQAALLGKCVIVALLGKDNLLPVLEPHHKANVGLLFMFLSICISAAGLSLQGWMAKRRLAGAPTACINGCEGISIGVMLLFFGQ